MAEGFIVEDIAFGGGVLQQHAKGILAEIVAFMVADHHVDTEGDSSRLHHGNGLRVAQLGDEEGVGFGFAGHHALAEGHGLGGGGSFIQHGGVGYLQAGEVADHRLEV